MSRATTSYYVLTREQIEAMARERRRLGLCAQVDALAGRHALLEVRARRIAEVYGVPGIPLPALRAVDRRDVDTLESFVITTTRAVAAAEREVAIVSSRARRSATTDRLAAIRTAAPVSVRSTAPAPASAPASGTVDTTSSAVPGPVVVAGPDRESARAERRCREDHAAAAELVAAIDERASGDRDFDEVIDELATATPARRNALLLWLSSEVQALNDHVSRIDETRRQLRVLAARAELVADETVRAQIARLADRFEATGEVELGRAEEAVTHAELVDEQRRSRDRLMGEVVERFERRGYVVVDPAGGDTGRFESLLQGAGRSEYAVGLDVHDDRVVFTTVRLVDERTAGQPADPDAPARSAVCSHIEDVVGELPAAGADVTRSEVSGTDATVVAAPGVVRHTRVARRADAPRAKELPGG